jgi:hypothetical protein
MKSYLTEVIEVALQAHNKHQQVTFQEIQQLKWITKPPLQDLAYSSNQNLGCDTISLSQYPNPTRQGP